MPTGVEVLGNVALDVVVGTNGFVDEVRITGPKVAVGVVAAGLDVT